MPATTNATRARPEPEPAARRRPWPAALAWSLYALVLLLFATFPVLDRLARHAGRPDLALLAPFVVAPSLAAFTASTVGAVLASRRPRHPVGWLLLILGLCMAIGGVIAGYLPYTVIIRPGALPGAGLLARIYAPLPDLALAALGLVRIISRTVAYGLLTVLLGLGYAAVVLGLGRLLPERSTLAVAAATLAVAAIFQPARRRVQAAVDSGSTAGATTPPGSSSGSAATSATRSTWTR